MDKKEILHHLNQIVFNQKQQKYQPNIAVSAIV
jgi:hypothetical protein